jgi:transcriptional regulator with XRE-family HTH domain
MEDETGIVSVVSENVRRARKAAALSQEELAFEAGLDRTYVSQVERRKRNLTIVVLARLAAALRVSPAKLVTPGRSARTSSKDSRRRGRA